MSEEQKGNRLSRAIEETKEHLALNCEYPDDDGPDDEDDYDDMDDDERRRRTHDDAEPF